MIDIVQGENRLAESLNLALPRWQSYVLKGGVQDICRFLSSPFGRWPSEFIYKASFLMARLAHPSLADAIGRSTFRSRNHRAMLAVTEQTKLPRFSGTVRSQEDTLIGQIASVMIVYLVGIWRLPRFDYRLLVIANGEDKVGLQALVPNTSTSKPASKTIAKMGWYRSRVDLLIHILHGLVQDDDGIVRSQPAPRTLYEYLQKPDEYRESRLTGERPGWWQRGTKSDLLQRVVEDRESGDKSENEIHDALYHQGFYLTEPDSFYINIASTAKLVRSAEFQSKLSRFRRVLKEGPSRDDHGP